MTSKAGQCGSLVLSLAPVALGEATTPCPEDTPAGPWRGPRGGEGGPPADIERSLANHVSEPPWGVDPGSPSAGRRPG